MGTTSWKSPSANSISTDNSKPWTNGSNAYSENDTYASVTTAATGYSDYQLFSGFGFTDSDFPAGALVTDVEVEVQGKVSNASNLLVLAFLYDSVGANLGTTTYSLGTTDDDTYVSGTENPLWGETVIPDSEIKGSDFGLAIASYNIDGSSDTLDIDHIRIRVHYKQRKLLRKSETNQGVSRTSDVVTVTRNASPTMNVQVGDMVVVSGVTPSSFNGTFLVESVNGTTSFTYNQAGSDESSTVHGTIGGDYSTLSTWESTEQTDLVTDGDSHELHCYADGTYSKTAAFSLLGWTTGASNTLTIKAAAGHEHKGVINGGVLFKDTGTEASPYAFAQSYLSVLDVEFELAGSNSARKVAFNYNGLNDIEVERCISVVTGTVTTGDLSVCFRGTSGSTGDTITFRNCLAKGGALGFSVEQQSGTGSEYASVKSCTVIDCVDAGISIPDETLKGSHLLTVDNCVVFGTTTGSDYDANTETFQLSNNNASEDSTAPGTSPLTGVTSADFYDYAGGDYRINPDSALYDAGADLSGTFADDITGTDRSQWSIGMFDPEVKTLKSSAGDYSLMSTWESTEQKDLVTANQLHYLECDAFTCTETNEVTISGWTTGASNTMTIKPASGAEHNGVVGAGFELYRAAGGFSSALNRIQNYLYVIGISITRFTSNASAHAVNASTGSTSTFEQCIFQGGSDSGSHGVNSGADSPGTFINCLALDSGGDGFSFGNFDYPKLYNCTSVNNGRYGFYRNGTGGTNATIKNCVAFGNGGAEFSGTNFSGNNNASEDATAPGTSPQTGVSSSDFVDAANDDFTPASGSTKLKGTGADLSGTFIDDITGTTRVTWDIGAYIAAAGGGLAVTDVDLDESIYDGQTGVICTLTGPWSATGKKVFLEQGGVFVEQTVTAQDASSATITVNYGSLSAGAATLYVYNPV